MLPGMDGGAELSAEFRALLCERGLPAEGVSYPSDEVLDYAALEERVRARLAEERGPTTLVAESFSGPVAISIAASPPPNLQRVVLVATFDRAPAPSLLAPFVRTAMFRRPPPAAFVRWKMLAKDATKSDIERVQAAIRDVDAEVLAARLRAVLRVNVQALARAIQLPVLSLRASQDRLIARALRLANQSWHEELIEGPHLLLNQRPTRCADAIACFLRP
ncbi:MAG: alpha/beta fold hydrolase [Polyangiales bacterium]